MSNPVGAQRYGLGGGDAYYDAVKYGGYTGTREQFGRDQAEFAENATAVAEAREEVERNTQTVVNTAQTFTEETVPAAIQSVEEKGDTEEDRLELRTTELVEAVNTAGAVQVQAVRDEGTTQTGLISGAGTAQVEAVEQAGSDQVDAVELAGSTQVENVNNAGTTQVGNVNQAGTTQVGDVNTAGAAQVQAVEDKGEEVLNSIPEDYSDLTEEVDNLKSVFDDKIVYEEIQFSDPSLKQYIPTNGSTVSWDNPSISSSTYIKWAVVECSEGDQFTINGKGGNSDRLWAFANASKGIISNASPGATETNLVITAPANAKYLIINDESNQLSFKNNKKKYIDDEVGVEADSISANAVAKEKTDFVKVRPQNLVNLSDMVSGIVSNLAYKGTVDSASGWKTTDFIPVEPGETYSLYYTLGVYYGQGDNGIPYYSKDKTYMGRIIPDGGKSTAEKQDSITIPNDSNIGYIRTSFQATTVSNPNTWYKTMIVKGNWVGNLYIPYDGEHRILGAGLSKEFSAPLNCLFGKSAIWDGDSIASADNDPLGGWSYRIASSNGMSCKKYAVAGGTIAENVGADVHSVSATLDTMISDFPNADYILIEGGTNDADLLGTDGIGTFDSDDFSSEYITALDKDTFSGALESVFYRLVTQMKGKHIGYIIPQKMGHTDTLVAGRRTYFDRAIDICKKWGIPYLVLGNEYYFNWELSAHWDQTMTIAENEEAGNLYIDGQHLTTTGYAIQSPVIAEWMKTI